MSQGFSRNKIDGIHSLIRFPVDVIDRFFLQSGILLQGVSTVSFSQIYFVIQKLVKVKLTETHLRTYSPKFSDIWNIVLVFL